MRKTFRYQLLRIMGKDAEKKEKNNRRKLSNIRKKKLSIDSGKKERNTIRCL